MRRTTSAAPSTCTSATSRRWRRGRRPHRSRCRGQRLRHREGGRREMHPVPVLRERLPARARLRRQGASAAALLENACVQCGLCVNTCPEDAHLLRRASTCGPRRRRPAPCTKTRPATVCAAARPSARPPRCAPWWRGCRARAVRHRGAAQATADVRRLPGDRHDGTRRDAGCPGCGGAPVNTLDTRADAISPEDEDRAGFYGLSPTCWRSRRTPVLLASLAGAEPLEPAPACRGRGSGAGLERFGPPRGKPTRRPSPRSGAGCSPRRANPRR